MHSCPLVTIITPTSNRQHLHADLWECIKQQDWPHFEWLVEDSSPEPSRVLSDLTDHRIQYTHSSDRVSVGAMRNRLVSKASGEYVIHFDDDDYYGRRYITFMVTQMQAAGADAIKLSSFYIYHIPDKLFYYWNLEDQGRASFICAPRTPATYSIFTHGEPPANPTHRLGYGFSYAYKKALWELSPFPDRNFGEDIHFMKAVITNGRLALLRDEEAICLHIVHGSNLSACFPQYELPPHLLRLLFPTLPSFVSSDLEKPARPSIVTNRGTSRDRII